MNKTGNLTHEQARSQGKRGKTLCILSHPLGDSVCLLSKIRFLAERYGEPVDILIKNGALCRIYEGLDYIGRIFVVPHWKFYPLLILKIRSLKIDRYDRVYFFAPQHMHKFLRVFSITGGIPPQINLGLPKEIRKCETHPHSMGRPAFRPVMLATTGQEREDVRRLLRETYEWRGEQLILVHPGCSYTAERRKRKTDNPKQWPVENWKETISEIGKLAPNAMFVLTGTADERGLTEEILVGARGKAVSLSGVLSLHSLMALQTIAHSCITIDTGAAHTAVAVGCPAVILYGAIDPRTMGVCSPKGWGPTITVRGFRDHAELNATKCRDPIKNIRPETVVRLWEKLPPRPNELSSECLVSHYCDGEMTPEVLPIHFG